MRSRLIAIFPLLALASSALLFTAPGPAAGQTPPDDRGRGVVLEGLKRSPPDGPCRGNFEFAHPDRVGGTTKVPCTHGPDPAPEGVDVRKRRPPEPQTGADTTPSGGTAESSGPIPCYGDGTDGYRLQVIYAHASDVADRYADYASSLVKWTAAVDSVVSASAAETGGTRHVRFVTDNCNLVVAKVRLTSTGDDNFDNTIAELRSQGYNRTDRKYLVYTDANVYCGIGQIYLDDRGDPTPGVNHNNGNTQVPGTVARVDNGCWGQANSVEAHELMHNLGGVQATAPHATSNFHCTDENDRMCYADGSVSALTYPCASTHENRFDCNHDDYFSTNPPLLSYLAVYWNSANSAFLARTEPTTTPPANKSSQVGDYDGNGTTDLAVFRPSNGTWYVRNGDPSSVGYGTNGDIPVPGDYDGNGTTDPAVFRPSNGTWYLRNGNPSSVAYGIKGDIPVPADYDGNGTTDLAVFRPSNGTWYVRNGNPSSVVYGTNGDIPVPGDYDGNGTADLAVFRPSNGTWYVRNASPGSVGYGIKGDLPVPADYDGNGTTDLAVFRPSNGTWYVRNGNFSSVGYGTNGDIPVPGDYDGNATTDLAVFRPSNGTWYVRNGNPSSVGYGTNGDIPVSLLAATRLAANPG